MEQDLKTLTAQMSQCSSLEALENIRVQLIGKSGIITTMLKSLGGLEPEHRREKGLQVNQIKESITKQLDERRAALVKQSLEARLQQEKIDISLSVRPQSKGTLHPLTRSLEDITGYFTRQGFSIVQGPDVEDEYHNFTALNMPSHHPARQSHDTFYLEEAGKLLRTHTSTVQIRALQKTSPPLRILSHGRVYRCDWDATHTPMFHQVEGLVIEKGIHMGHLKSCIMSFLRYFFDRADLPVRLRPSFFPFTEPSAEVDIGYSRQKGSLDIGGDDEWLEVLGCGMVHPKVLENCNIDSKEYQGFAFGMGMDRLTMLKYGLDDIRSFFEGDVRWLKHYGFSPFMFSGV
jgi:phenylalanyl-tRNA synthetase alpha chain